MITRTEIKKRGPVKHQTVVRGQEVREQVAEALDDQLLWELKSFTAMKEVEAGAKVFRELGCRDWDDQILQQK